MSKPLPDAEIVKRLRELATEATPKWVTHPEGCWSWHPGCALALAADTIARLTEEPPQNTGVRAYDE